MFAAFDWNEVWTKAQIGGVLGGVAGACVSLFMYLMPKSDGKKDVRADATGLTRPPVKTGGNQKLLPVLLFFMVSAATYVIVLATPLVRFQGEATAPTITISDYGRYRTADSNRNVPNRTTPDDVTAASEREYVLLEQTDQIPCRVGETWGIRIHSSTALKNRSYLVRGEIHHPPIKQSGDVTRTMDSREFRVPPDALFSHSCCWQFLKGHEHELVAGDWTWVVFVDNVEVERRTFKVRK